MKFSTKRIINQENTEITLYTGVLVGAVIYYLVYQVIIFVGFDTDLLKMFSALVVAVFLGVPYVKKQLARKHRVKGGIRHA